MYFSVLFVLFLRTKYIRLFRTLSVYVHSHYMYSHKASSMFYQFQITFLLLWTSSLKYDQVHKLSVEEDDFYVRKHKWVSDLMYFNIKACFAFGVCVIKTASLLRSEEQVMCFIRRLWSSYAYTWISIKILEMLFLKSVSKKKKSVW